MKRIVYFDQMRRTADKTGKYVYQVTGDDNKVVYETSDSFDAKLKTYERNWTIWTVRKVRRSTEVA